MAIVTTESAETRLLELLARMEAGEEIILARDAKPVAKLTPYAAPTGKRQFGAMRGLGEVGPEFLDPLPEEELAGWE